MSAPLDRGARIVVAGAGLMGRWHAHAAERVGATVVAIVDPQPGAAKALAARHRGAATFAALDDALSAVGVDVLHVCTPVESHAPLVEAGLGNGCHALVEKPLAGSLAETETLLARARAGGLALNPVHQFPFQPGFSGLLERRDRLGEIVRIAYRTCSAGGDGLAEEGRRRLLLEILPHPVSLLHRWLLGSFEHPELNVVRFSDDDLDLVGSQGDVLLEVSLSLRGRPTRNELEIVGTRATALVDLFHGYAIVESGRVSRRAKALRPFRLGGQLAAHAGGNLAGRALRREPAYPGLPSSCGSSRPGARRGSER